MTSDVRPLPSRPAGKRRTAAVLIFAAEVGLLGFLTVMLALLLTLVPELGELRWSALMLIGGIWGVGALWWMLFAFGLPGGARRARTPWPVRGGLATGVLLAGYLVGRVFLERQLSLAVQAAVLFGAPIAIMIHLVVLSRRRPAP